MAHLCKSILRDGQFFISSVDKTSAPKILRYFRRRVNFVTVSVNKTSMSPKTFLVVVARIASYTK